MKQILALFGAISLLAWCSPLLAQSSVPAIAASTPSVAAEVDSYGKAIGAVVTAMAALFGLPIVFLTYRKTRAEIAKLELEANALREKQGNQPDRTKDLEGNIRINIERSPGVTVQVLADPRFLAPLLLLVDFIFAWVVLTLADRFFAIFATGIVRSGALAILAAVLLLPIAKQVLRVRAVLSPPRTPEELRASLRQTTAAVYVSYLLVVFSSIGFGAFLLLTVSSASITQAGRYLAWASLGAGVVLVAVIPLLRPRFKKYIESAGRQ